MAEPCCNSGTSGQNAGATMEPQPELASAREALFRISAMDCATEETEIRHALSGLDGIRSLRFVLADRVLAIDAEAAALNSALAAIRRLGFSPEPISADHRQTADQIRTERRLERLRLGFPGTGAYGGAPASGRSRLPGL